MKPELGKWYECTNCVMMNNSNNDIEFIARRIYKSEVDGALTNESGNNNHYWLNEDPSEGVQMHDHFQEYDFEEIS